MSGLILTIHVGEVNTLIGIFDGALQKRVMRFETRQSCSADEYALWLLHLFKIAAIAAEDIACCIVSCMYSPIKPELQQAVKSMLGKEPMFMRPGLKTGIQIQAIRQEDFSAERVANMVAAAGRGFGACLIVDLGAITRIDVLTSTRQHLGSVVTLGVQKSLDSLARITPGYPSASIEKPRAVIGKFAADAVQSGAYYGTISMLEGLTEKILYEMKNLEKVDEKVHVIATGGYAEALSTQTEIFDSV